MVNEVILAFKEGHDPAAALMINGEIVAAVEEERFTRDKHAPSQFPKKSIDYCLEVLKPYGFSVTEVVLARRKPIITALKVFFYYLSHPVFTFYNYRYVLGHIKVQLKGCIEQLKGTARYQLIRKLYPELPKKIQSIDHHLGHAASAYYFSGFEDSLVITWDGKGEEKSITVSIGIRGKLKKIHSWGILSSLGLIYSSITELLGFAPNDGEYKVMGMAALGSPNFDLSDLFKTKTFNGKNSPINFKWATRLNQYLVKKDIVINDNTKFDIAASFQYFLEEICLMITKFWLLKTNQSNLSIAGGVGLNVKVNQRIWEKLDLNDLYVQPAAGDAGLVLGACALVNKRNNLYPIKLLENMYLGPSYESDQCTKYLENSGLNFYEVSDVAKRAAVFIKEGMVIGWFQGRMEFGPRALGNRSVLADPTRDKMQDHVNLKIKFREEFRPFCPTTTLDYAESIFVKPKISPYMTIAFTALEGISNFIPAVIHLDNTSRPQTLTREANPLYFQLLIELEKLNKYPVVLNTSMNVRGEPMCLTPLDAIDFFVNTNIDVMIIDNFICEKSNQNEFINKDISDNRIKSNY